jgi:hypothetical protein
MTESRALILGIAGLAGAALTWTMLATPTNAGAGSGSMTLPAAQATESPRVEGSKSRDGVQLDSWRGDEGRFPSKQNKPKRQDNSQAETSTDPREREKSVPGDHRPPPPTELRLNTGICGRPGADGTVPGPTWCQPVGPDEPVVPTPGVPVNVPRPEDVNWEQVLAESRNVAFPGLGVKVQPTGRTLVNLETIVYTDQSRVSTARVTLLGFPVEVEATPMSYVWRFGDGATLTTTTPGKPYPAKEITHKYLKKGSVGLTLTTNYAARFRVAGGAWQYVDGTVPITGPATPLLVREAVPVLVDPER